MSAPVVIEVIGHCWTRIEPYLDIISLISVSKSCNKLRQLVVDEDSGKIKASILKVPSTLEDDCPYGPISEHGPRLLNMVHFPSLKKLHISFPLVIKNTWTGRVDDQILENNFPLALPTLANLSKDAYNLEELDIYVNGLIPFEDSGRPQVAYNILKNNLIRCIKRTKKLRELSIMNCDDKRYSTAFFDAMVPVVKAGVCLENVFLYCGGSPVPASSDHADALHDFLEAALSLQNLRQFRINAMVFDYEYGPLVNSLMGACQSIEKSWGEIPSKKLAFFGLLIAGPGKSDIQLQPIHQMLSLLSEAKSLELMLLWLPLSYWNRDNISALSTYIERPSSFKVAADFEGYKDSTGKLVNIMQKVVENRTDVTHVGLRHIGYLAEQSDSIQALGQYVEKVEYEGETTWDFEYDPDK